MIVKGQLEDAGLMSVVGGSALIHEAERGHQLTWRICQSGVSKYNFAAAVLAFKMPEGEVG
jgi:hypothetical protein